MTVEGSMPRARAMSRNSATSSRRSPRSNFETKDCGRPSLFARATCVSPASWRAWTSSFRNCACVRLKADFVTDAVCYPELEYPKMGYTGASIVSPEEPTMPTNDPERLRAALDRIANALQPAGTKTSVPRRVISTPAVRTCGPRRRV